MSEKPTKIISLQGLRALAFIGIFIEHAGFMSLGAWGVSCFLVLSGFLMYYNYGMLIDTSKDGYSLRDNIVFAVRKIKKLYPLHCITLLVAICVYWDNQKLDGIKRVLIWGVKLVSNFTLLQSWIPKAEFYFSFNGVSWYLSTCVALYSVFPYIRKAINKVKNKNEIIFQFILVIAIQTAISVLLIVYEEQVSNVPIAISDDVTKYVTYICPLYRMGDFYIGCLLGYIFKKKCLFVKENKALFSVMEIMALFSIYFLEIVYRRKVSFLGMDAFRYTLLYTLQVMILVILVGINKGVISKYILSSKIMVTIGNLSGYAFLIHQLVIVIVWRIFGADVAKQSICAMISFMCTMLLAYMWQWIQSNIKVIDCKK